MSFTRRVAALAHVAAATIACGATTRPQVALPASPPVEPRQPPTEATPGAANRVARTAATIAEGDVRTLDLPLIPPPSHRSLTR